MIKYIFLVLVILATIGCSTTTVKDGYVTAGQNKKIQVQAQHASAFQKYTGVWVDVWWLRIANNDQGKDWCVAIEWRALDYTINVPNVWFYVTASSRLRIGSAVQKTWEFGRSALTFDDAGFAVYKVLLRKPNGDSCNAD